MNIPKTAKLIKDSIHNYIDIDGNVYAIDGRNNHSKIIKKVQKTSHGYKYCGIRYEKGVISKRVHRLVAEAFLENTNNYKIVGHKNNIKSDNRVENLYWTTTSENTKKAYDDGLVENKKGFECSQSKPVCMFETKTNKLIKKFGSMKIAEKETGILATTISRQCKYHRPVRREYYFRFVDEESVINETPLVYMYDYGTDKLLKTFINPSEAHRETNISSRTISQQVKNNKKPRNKNAKVYFLNSKQINA